MIKMIKLVLLFNLTIFYFNCSPENNEDLEITLSSISPTYMVPNMPDFILTASGENFSSDSKIVIDGIEQETTFLDSTSLSCVIKPEVVWPGAKSAKTFVKSNFTPSTSSVHVINSTSGSEVQSAAINFEYIENNKFSYTIEVATTSGNGGFSMSVIDSKGNIHIVWDDGNNIYYSQSTDNGESWSSKKKVSDHNSTSGWPNIAIDDNDFIYVVWNNYLNGTGIYFSKTINGGVDWSTQERIGEGQYPVISSGTNGFLALTFNLSSLDSEIFSITSSDNGDNWYSAVQVSNGSRPSANAETIIDKEGTIYCTWKGVANDIQRVYVSYSNDMGMTWAEVTELSDGTTYYTRPVIATDNNGNVYVVWFNLDSARRCFFSRSLDNGKTWSLSNNIPSGIYAMDPDITCDPFGNIYMVWKGSDGIYTSRSTDTGDTWSDSVKISSDFGLADYPEIEVDKSGNVYLFMQFGNYVPNTKILFSKSDSNFTFISD